MLKLGRFGPFALALCVLPLASCAGEADGAGRRGTELHCEHVLEDGTSALAWSDELPFVHFEISGHEALVGGGVSVGTVAVATAEFHLTDARYWLEVIPLPPRPSSLHVRKNGTLIAVGGCEQAEVAP